MFTFLSEVKTELDHVTWPSGQVVFRMTFVVIGISLFAGIYLGGADFLFTNLLGLLVR